MIATIMLSTAFTSVVNASINYDTPDSKYFPYISIHNQLGEDCWLHSLVVISNYIYGDHRYTEENEFNKLKNNSNNYTYTIKITPEFVDFITTTFASIIRFQSPDEVRNLLFNDTASFFAPFMTNMTNVTNISESDVYNGNGPTFIYWQNFTEQNGADCFVQYGEFNELTKGEYRLGPSMAAMFNPYSQPLAIYLLYGPDLVKNDTMRWFGGHAIPSYIQIGPGGDFGINGWLEGHGNRDVFNLYVKLWRKDPQVAGIQDHVYYAKSNYMNPVVNNSNNKTVMVENPYLIDAANNGLLNNGTIDNIINTNDITNLVNDNKGSGNSYSGFGLGKTGFPLISLLIVLVCLITGRLYRRKK